MATTRERLHEVVDELSEQEADDALEYVASRREARAATGDADAWGGLSAMTRASSGRTLSRLDEEEIAEHGETIAEAFERAERESSR